MLYDLGVTNEMLYCEEFGKYLISYKYICLDMVVVFIPKI